MKNVALIFIMSLAGCKQTKTLPASMTGTFYQNAEFPGTEKTLTVLGTGISVKGGFGMSMDMSAFKGGKIEIGSNASDLFRSVSCSKDSCDFKTQNGCNGTLAKNSKGEMDVVTSGNCSSWSGHWVKEISATKMEININDTNKGSMPLPERKEMDESFKKTSDEFEKKSEEMAKMKEQFEKDKTNMEKEMQRMRGEMGK